MPLVRGITSLVGLGTEAYAHHKEKKERSRSPQPGDHSSGHEQQANYTTEDDKLSPQASNTLAPHPTHRTRSGSQGSNHSATSSFYDDDEQDWVQDEAENELEHRNPSDDNRTVDQMIDDFTRAHPPPQYSTATGKLPCPVVIPQKRPESKTHGFVRAYAPALDDCGMDQATFLEFMDNFSKSIKGSGYFNTVNLAIAASVLAYTVASVSVNPIVHVTAFFVHSSIEAGRRVHNTSQVNKYMKRMNEELFQPHGLYAMIMTYKPDCTLSNVNMNPDGTMEMPSQSDIEANTLSSVAARAIGDRSKYRSASGKTLGEAALPESCPLIFPALEAAPDEKKQNALKRAGKFMSDLQDKKAQAQFEHNNSNSRLNTGQEKKFASAFSDPNHPIHKGGPLNLLTGGYLYKGQQKLIEKNHPAANFMPLRMRRQAGRANTGVGGKKTGVKRLIGENVLYLMVVNMPMETEMKEAVQYAEMVKEAQKRGEMSGSQQQPPMQQMPQY